ncbi:calcium-binding protein [Brevundimonas sp.]|uniref:calcium-binding protein n=1 Tax=Brevundimonas sp. TaxID=1871086 RepID=UPI002D633650|nr:calcium-binding protein [Brevundimonas sp.]HYC66916.1 calcium-binding protein [Brevundimonas sp.]
MTYNISTTQRLAPGQSWTITDGIGVNFVSPAPGQSVVSFNNAGTILINTSSPFIVAGINYDYGSLHEGSVFTNEATGVIRINSTGGQNMTIGFTSAQGFGGWNGDLVNHGVFEIVAAQDALGVRTSDMTFVFTNTNRFTVRSSHDAWGVLASNGATVTNSGLLEVTGFTAVGVRAEREAEITNSGTIRAVATSAEGWSIGIGVSHSELKVSHIVNTGLIEAEYAILDETAWSPPQAAAQVVTNSGQIVGVVDLARGDDQLINSGSITGEVWLGYGADIYDGRGGSHLGAVHGGFGDDDLIGGDAGDILFGEDGDDHLIGGGGNDVLQGGRGNNTIDAGAGIDVLTYASLTIGVDLDLAAGVAAAAGQDQISGVENVHGSRWADRLRGDAVGNLLFGADGDDTIDGRGGADELVGGRGADTLSGGAGADTFRFGLGDGADVITDLTSADTLVIHGYSAWREIVQSGADVRIILSDTDSILLRNTTIPVVSARTSFTASARPVYETGGEAPALLGETHVEIRGRFHILEGESVSFDGTAGTLALYGILEPGAGVTNGGLITVNASNSAGGVGLSGFNFGGDFDNLATGVLRVVTTGPEVMAVGVSSEGFDSAVTNHGLIDVRSTYSAVGLNGLQMAMSLLNTGILHVESAGRAWGANLHYHGSLENHGLIEVIGSGDVLGIRSLTYSTIVNHGTIRVEDRTGDSIGILLRSDVIEITNTGLIEADIAIDARGYSFEVSRSFLDNSGEIRGVVSLSSGDEKVTNTGLIDGEVRLNEGDDLYDGSAGRQTGPVHGGWGRDLLIGGAEADHLVGDDHSDTLIGGLGDDLLDGGEGDDFVSYAGPRSAYSWTVDGDTITMTGPDGVDTLQGVELLRFSDQLLSLTGYGIRERGLGGDDVLTGTELNDILDGGPVPHLLEIQGSTDNGDDRLFGFGGDDVLTGGGHADHLDGGEGDDQLDGGLDSDILLGGSGDDLLTGGSHSDHIDGGSGVDTAVFAGSLADYQIVTANGVTIITGPDRPDSWDPTIILNATDYLTSVERLQFSDQVLVLGASPTVGTDGADVIVGAGGADALSGGAGADRLEGGAGNDELEGGLGNDFLDGGLGYDTVRVEGAIEDYRLLVNGDGFILKGPDGSDRLIGIETIRFSQGGAIDLARQYGGGHDALVLPSLADKTPSSGPVTLPPDDGFISLPDTNDPLILPGLPDDGLQLDLSLIRPPELELKLAGDHALTLAGDPFLHAPDHRGSGFGSGGYDLLE